MKSIKVYFIAVIVFFSSFLVSSQSFSMDPNQDNEHVEYVMIDGEYYIVHYDTDGSVVYVQPINGD